MSTQSVNEAIPSPESVGRDNDGARFLRYLLGMVLGWALLLIAVVALVDPYGLYGSWQVPGLNMLKPRIERNREEMKLARALSLRPDTVLLGNSRAENGMDPALPIWQQHGMHPYNLALAAMRTVVAQHSYATLHQHGLRPRRVIVGVEFLDFLASPDRMPDPQVYVHEHDFDRLGWRVDAALSLASVEDAFKTLRLQHDPYAVIQTDLGFNPLQDYKKYAKEEGYYVLFQQRAEDYARSFRVQPHALRFKDSDISPDRAALRQLIEQASGDGAELVLYIYPYHAQIMELWRSDGLWPVFQQWKQMLVDDLDQFSKTHPQAHVSLWDFSGYSEVQCEQIPARGDRNHDMQWYWEAGHFKPALGQRLLAYLLDGHELSTPDHFHGVLLDKASLPEVAADIERQRQTCLAAYPELETQIRQLQAAAAH